MNKSLITGRKPHGYLDSGFAISDLRKEQPLYDFGAADRAARARRRPPPWEAASADSGRGGCYFDEDGRRRVEAVDWVRQSEQAAPQAAVMDVDPLLFSTDLAPGFNNSAANAAGLKQNLQVREAQRQPAVNPELLKQHLRQTYGSQLFSRGKYVAADELGPALPPVSGKSRLPMFKFLRSQIIGQVPQTVFNADASGTEASSESSLCSVFEWCDRNRNNSAGTGLSHRVIQRSVKRVQVRRALVNWVYLHFRVRRVSWEFLVHEERLNFHMIDLFSEGVLDKWTVKLRFRMVRESPMKFPMMAFLSRMGLESQSDIVFTTDGFYGDLLVGSQSNRNTVPHRQVGFNTTCQALGLQNGDSIFVVRASDSLRANVETHMEGARRRASSTVSSSIRVSEHDDEEDEEADEELTEEEDDKEDEEIDEEISGSNTVSRRQYGYGIRFQLK